MRHKVSKRSIRKNRKKIRAKTYSKKNGYGKTINIQKVVDFKFQSLGKIYKNFTEKREREKGKKEKLKEKDREKQIKEQQKQIEKLLNACNLEWDENCMQFYKNKHFMRTGSNSINIHQPIYKTSIQSWKRYEKQLQPLIEVLKT